MCREHPEHLARTAYKRRRLDGSGPGVEHGVKRRRSGEDRTAGDILDDHPFAHFQGAAAGRKTIMNVVKELEERSVEAAVGDNLQAAGAVKELYVAHIGRGNIYARCEYLFQQLRNSTRFDEPRTLFLPGGPPPRVPFQARV